MVEHSSKAALKDRLSNLPEADRAKLRQALEMRRSSQSAYGADGLRTHRSDSRMAFSLFFFSGDGTTRSNQKYSLLFDSARLADRSDIAAVWVPERHFVDFGGLYPNPSVLASALAAQTTRIGIRAGSVVLPLHHPVRVAEEWSVVDNISNGRIGVAFASGWHPKDFVIAPGGTGSYPARKDGMFRSIDQLRRLWRGEAISFDDGSDPVATLPRPIQSDLPIWIASQGSEETFRRAGEIGAGVLTGLVAQRREDLKHKIEVYRDAFRGASDTTGDGHVVSMLHTFLGEDDSAVKSQVRGPLIAYLSTFLDQKKDTGSPFAEMSAADREVMLNTTFERYYGANVLMGAQARCKAMVEDMVDLGVDEIACLIDFGLPDETVLDGLAHLKDLASTYAAPPHSN
ncbi:MAG: MupA/Atu3671 family FMN-dependent luciferase-like monooxygenase [Pseudomonadota bacterium]